MKAYRVTEVAEPEFHITRKDAHREAKAWKKSRAYDPRIELVDVPLDKESVVFYLNCVAFPFLQLPVLRTWALTDRGGLREVPNGE